MYMWDWKTGYNFQQLQTIAQPGSLDSEHGIYKTTFDMVCAVLLRSSTACALLALMLFALSACRSRSQTGSRLLTGEADKTIKVWKEDETAVSMPCSRFCSMRAQWILCVPADTRDTSRKFQASEKAQEILNALFYACSVFTLYCTVLLVAQAKRLTNSRLHPNIHLAHHLPNHKRVKLGERSQSTSALTRNGAL
jgi:hypothetical protein